MNRLLDYLAETHQPYLHAKGEAATELLLKWLDCRPGENVLEFGVGTGGTLVKVAAGYRQTRLWGVDISDKMLRKAGKRLMFCGLFKKVILQKTNGRHLETFADNFFDKIYIESVLGIQEDATLTGLLAEFGRILKPKGKLVLNETLWLESTDAETIARFNEFVKQNFGIIQANAAYPYLKDWMALLRASHFEVVKTQEADTVIAERRPLNFREKLSTLFTLSGSIYGKMFLRRSFRQFAEATASTPFNRPVMAGYLIMASCTKP
ncbi:MAG: class I SAM-dependent methyltransferase [Spirosomataceae bacterium]